MSITDIQLITAIGGAWGYAILCNLRKDLQPWAALGGFICWGTYLLSQSLLGKEFLAEAEYDGPMEEFLKSFFAD